MSDSSKTIIFDCDGVIADKGCDGVYAEAKPLSHGIDQVNAAYDMGFHIILFTARYGDREDGCMQRQYGRGYVEWVTWLEENGVKYHEAWMGKPAGILYVDDKAARVRGDDSEGWSEFWKELKATRNKDKYGNDANQDNWTPQQLNYWDSFLG
jgi:hypothetical protein